MATTTKKLENILGIPTAQLADLQNLIKNFTDFDNQFSDIKSELKAEAEDKFRVCSDRLARLLNLKPGDADKAILGLLGVKTKQQFVGMTSGGSFAATEVVLTFIVQAERQKS